MTTLGQTVVSVRLKRLKIGAFIIFLLLLSLRLHLISTPFFNMDEGIGAVCANTMLDGGVYYRDAIDQRGPVAYCIYALIFFLFGRNNMVALHAALMLIILFTAVIIYNSAKLLWGRMAGFWATVLFGVFSYTYEPGDMFAFHTEWACIMLTCIGAYLLVSYFLKENSFFLFLGGLAFGLAAFTKQVAFLDGLAAFLFLGLYCVMNKKAAGEWLRALSLFLAGFFLVGAAFISYYYFNGALKDFVFYYHTYNFNFYAAALSGYERARLALVYFTKPDSFLRNNFLLVIIFICGGILAFRGFLSSRDKKGAVSLTGVYFACWGIAAYLGASVTGRCYGHYYIMLLPSFCLLAGWTIQHIRGQLRHIGALHLEASSLKILFTVILIIGMGSPLVYYYMLNVRRMFNPPDIYDSLGVPAEYIKHNTGPKDKIFVWGFYPEIYVMTDRMPATRYTYCNFLTGMLPWVNTAPSVDTRRTRVPGSWRVLMEELERNKPVYIIDTSIGDHRAYGKYPISGFPKLAAYIREYYTEEITFPSQNRHSSLRLYHRKE